MAFFKFRKGGDEQSAPVAAPESIEALRKRARHRLIGAAVLVLLGVIHRSLKRLPVRLAEGNEYGAWVPFGATVGVFLLSFYGLAYSLFPWLVIDRITVWQGTISASSMGVILVGACIVLPVIIGYTVFAYRVFWGKSTHLSY